MRIYYPGLLSLPDDEMVMITDMDMLPTNNSYYINELNAYIKDDFIYYRHVDGNQIYMCYNAAHPNTWAKVFEIGSAEDIEKAIKANYTKQYSGVPGSSGWFIDQETMYSHLIGYKYLKVLNRPIKRLEIDMYRQHLKRNDTDFIKGYDDVHFHRNFFNNLPLIHDAEQQLTKKSKKISSIQTNWIIVRKEDVISTDKYLELQSNIIKYIKTDALVAGGPVKWRGELHSYSPAPVWITGHSDCGITESIYRSHASSCKKWYTVNKECVQPNLHSIPLGLTNDCDDSVIHRILGNIDCMLPLMYKERKIKNLVYMNFSNTHVERGKIWTLFKNKSWVTSVNSDISIEGRTLYLEDIRNHNFVLCPRGNGIDTHRLWETLYMGSIPIVQHNTAVDEFSDLPICWIKNWEDVTEAYLNAEQDRIARSSWNIAKLTFGYWKEKICA
jgi:hypothetical protein